MDTKSIIESLEKTDIIEDLLTPAPIVEPGAVINFNTMGSRGEQFPTLQGRRYTNPLKWKSRFKIAFCY